MKQRFWDRHWWGNRLRYQPLVQRFFLFWSLSDQFPATLNLEPTNFCDLNCSFCPVKKSRRRRGQMDWELYRQIVDEVAQEKKLSVLWLHKDGEPLWHPQIDQMVALAQKKEIAGRIEIYTNGLKLTESMAQRLIEAQLDSLVVSLDATSRQSFKKLKGKDSYDQVVANIHQFLRIREKLRAKKPLLSLKTINFSPQEVRKFREIWSGVADCVAIQSLHEWEGSINYQLSTINYQLSKRYPCNLPWLSPAVNWDGKVVPCCVNFRENELVMGDLTKLSLREIWQGDKFKRLRQAHLEQNFADWPTCARCTFWKQLPNMRTILKIKNKILK